MNTTPTTHHAASRPLLPVALLLVLCIALALSLAGCASPNSAERTGRPGGGDMRQDMYVSQIEGFEYRVYINEDDLMTAYNESATKSVNTADAERRARNYMAAAFPLRQSLVVTSVIEMPLLGTEKPPRDPNDVPSGKPLTYFLVSLRSTHEPRFPQDVDMVKLIVLPNGKIVPFRAKGQWISMLRGGGDCRVQQFA